MAHAVSLWRRLGSPGKGSGRKIRQLDNDAGIRGSGSRTLLGLPVHYYRIDRVDVRSSSPTPIGIDATPSDSSRYPESQGQITRRRRWLSTRRSASRNYLDTLTGGDSEEFSISTGGDLRFKSAQLRESGCDNPSDDTGFRWHKHSDLTSSCGSQLSWAAHHPRKLIRRV